MKKHQLFSCSFGGRVSIDNEFDEPEDIIVSVDAGVAITVIEQETFTRLLRHSLLHEQYT